MILEQNKNADLTGKSKMKMRRKRKWGVNKGLFSKVRPLDRPQANRVLLFQDIHFLVLTIKKFKRLFGANLNVRKKEK